MSNEIHDEEERDLIDAADLDMRTTPMFRTAPERIGLAVGDELEDWMSEFDDCDEICWYAGEPPVQVCIGYVRADLHDELVDGWAVYSFAPEIDPHYTHCRYLVAFREQGTTCYLRSNGEAVKAGEGRNIIQAQRDADLLAKWRGE